MPGRRTIWENTRKGTFANIGLQTVAHGVAVLLLHHPMPRVKVCGYERTGNSNNRIIGVISRNRLFAGYSFVPTDESRPRERIIDAFHNALLRVDSEGEDIEKLDRPGTVLTLCTTRLSTSWE